MKAKIDVSAEKSPDSGFIRKKSSPARFLTLVPAALQPKH